MEIQKISSIIIVSFFFSLWISFFVGRIENGGYGQGLWLDMNRLYLLESTPSFVTLVFFDRCFGHI